MMLDLDNLYFLWNSGRNGKNQTIIFLGRQQKPTAISSCFNFLKSSDFLMQAACLRNSVASLLTVLHASKALYMSHLTITSFGCKEQLVGVSENCSPAHWGNTPQICPIWLELLSLPSFDKKKTDRSHLGVGTWIWLVLSNLSQYFGTYGILIIGAWQSAGRSCCRHYNEPILMTCKPTLREFIMSLAIAGTRDEEGIWYTTWIAEDMLNVDRVCHDARVSNH